MENILVFDVLFLDKYGALASATIYTALLFVILAFHWERVGNAFRAILAAAPSERMTLQGKAKLGFAALVLMALLFAFDQGLVNVFGHGKG
jgi:hypothetical protein